MGDEPANRVRWRLQRFDTIDSTNRWVLDEARAGAPAGLVAIADHQSAGRGRRGRTWIAPSGSSLLVSVLLRPELAIEDVQLVMMAAALALRDAVREIAGVHADVKWPNDLVVNDRKLAGVLAEADVDASGEVNAVVVGIGCNVQWDDVPPELAEIATACNLEAGRDVDRARLLDAFLDALADQLKRLDAVASGYRAALGTLGRSVRVELGDRVLEGVATAVDDAGRLVVTPDGGAPEVVAAGDVVHLRTR
jgi:BirA family transcriptional regulator, biotin operon repressor / biotin---[acetyl-CoA-carboxylase] ligase